ncbi:MAG: HAD-IIIC family phosphatase [Bdellovibrionales bacterium]
MRSFGTALNTTMKIKLIIWDLDETLWHGTLAEGDDVVLIERRAESIRKLNESGIVSAICSKNDPAQAQAKLEELGLWEAFVFPRISFVPKAPVLAQMIEDMQLRPVNVLFVDDNVHNLNEAKHLLPDLQIIDASTDVCDALLDDLVEKNKDVHKSRVESYRILEKKAQDREVAHQSTEDFLRACDIHVCLVQRTDALDFAPRIEELLNRSNQLNFTKSRMKEGEGEAMIVQGQRFYSIAVFVWDKYGYYGLVGFAGVEKFKDLTHFAFSCRIMHMGIENWVLARIQELLPQVRHIRVPVSPSKPEWITEELYQDSAVRQKIWAQEFPDVKVETKLRFIANCQSGALAHFSGLAPVSEFDNTAFYFELRRLIKGDGKKHVFPPYLVFAAFVDYGKDWPGATVEQEAVVFEKCVRQFCSFVGQNKIKMFLIIPPEDAPEDKFQPENQLTRERVILFNDAWRRAAREFPDITSLEVASMANPDEMVDVRHYGITLLKKISDQIASWYAQVSDDGQRIREVG